MKPLFFIALLAAAQPALAKKSPAPAAAPAQPDVSALIECRGTLQDFRALAGQLDDAAKLAALGFSPLPQLNPYLREFALRQPIAAFGDHTARIAFTSDSIVAILDQPDPRPLAHRLQLETAMDTPQRAMFGKEVRGAVVRDAQTGAPMYDSAVLDVSNVGTHPGKTLAGCSYGLDAMDESEAGSAAAPASGH